MNLLKALKSNFISQKSNILKYALATIGVILVIFLSGAGFTSFGMSGKSRIVLYALAFIYFVSVFVLKIRTSFFREALEKKKIPIPRPLALIVMAIIFFCLLSLIFNQNKAENINTYIAFVLTIVLAFLILSSFDQKMILNIFRYVVFALLSIAIIVFLLTYVSKVFFSPFYYVGEKTIYGTHFLLTNDTISGLTNTYYFKTRLTSLFWEPSVLGTILILALIAEIYCKKDKLTILRVLVFIVGIFLSESTAAYLLLPFVLILFITEKSSNLYIKAAAVFFLVILVLVIFMYMDQVIDFLVKFLPDVFGKITSNKTGSFSTRTQSFGNCLTVFAKNPVFGFGGVTARDEYFAVAGNIVDAQTSTFGVVLASFGFGGLFYIIGIVLGIVLCKKIDSFSKIVLIIILFLISNVQSQSEILMVNILYLMPLSFVLLPKKAEKRNRQCFERSYNSTKTIKDSILSKNDNGEVSRNVIGALILKGIAIFLAFFTIPVYLKYFNSNNSTYGIWVAITSILSLVTVFDFGMGNGLKNKLIKNISDGNDELSKTYISTTYVLTAIIGMLIFITFSIVIFTLSDATIMNVFYSGQDQNNIDLMSFRIGVAIILFAIGSQFFMKNINYVLQAHQKNAITGVFMVITNGCLMLFALIFARVIPEKYKIIVLASAYFFFLIVPLLVASIVLYSKKYKSIAPSLKFVNFSKSKAVINTSFRFFAVQIGNLFLWSINEFTILFVFNYQSALVTEYTEYYKLFSLMPIILGTVIQQPLWTALAKAEAESNKSAIKKYTIVLMIATLLCLLFNMVLSVSLSFVFDIWLGTSAPAVTSGKIIAFIAYSIIYTISVMLVIIMNAFSLFKTQIITAGLAILLKIPLIYLITNVFNWNVGWEVVIYVNTLCYLPILIFGSFEIIKHLKNKNLLWRRNNEKEAK